MPNLSELDPDSPDYEAALEAAQAEEDAALGNTVKDEDETPDGEAPAAVAKESAEPTAEAAPAPEETPADPAADAGQPPADAPIAGVLSADGKRVLPYVALKAERRAASHERRLRETAERERDEALRRLEELKAGKDPEADPDALTDEDLEDLKLIGPAGAKAVARLKAAEERLKQLPAAAEPEAEPIDPRQAAAEAVQEDIDQIPLLLEWQASDPEKFERARELDSVLSKSRKWSGKPQVERFLHVTALVADEFDVPFQASPRTTPTPPPKANPQEALSKAPRVAPSTLSDFKGGSVDQTESRIESLPPAKAMAALANRSDAEIDAWLAKSG